ncbi:MAG: PDZ domain-containing protein [Candidatus Eremiobacteraeota bacterium]|nr:PDZ domain-containing protein [Candidatus Eremiobacteraeota bacterium]MBV8367177.1 PDZ domain-containing protein [Candidatus Eremiobacteraeota bacterium]
MSNAGYYRQPTIAGDVIAFVCEDDLWSVPVSGGTARRLTAGLGECSTPRFSPDGRHIAFIGREEGVPEVCVIPSEGGDAVRLTYLGAETCAITGWSPDGESVLFATDGRSPFLRHTEAFAIDRRGGNPQPLNLGHLLSLDIAKNGAKVIGRNNNDPARWKRYRGGTSGEIWVDASGAGTFTKLPSLGGNTVTPMWVAGRIYFLSDHEGIGNLYSCKADGSDVRRHTDHDEYYVRFPSSDGTRVVYAAGGDLYVHNAASDTTARIEVSAPSGTTQTARRFVDAAPTLEHFAPHPDGRSLALIARGQPFTMPLWEEAVTHHGTGSRVRYRHASWLRDGLRFVAVTDEGGSEHLQIFWADDSQPAVNVSDIDLGRIVGLAVSPTADVVAVANHRHELAIVNLDSGQARVVDRSPGMRVSDLAWSPDGRWVAYTYAPHGDQSIIRVAEASTGNVRDITAPLRFDRSPAWDPDGKYLYFLSTRDFNPVYDALQFDLSFPFAMRPFLVTLRGDTPSPFVPKARAFDGAPKTPAPHEYDEPAHDDGPARTSAPGSTTDVLARVPTATKAETKPAEPAPPAPSESPKPSASVEIDFEGINGRVIGFPVDEGRYDQIAGAPGRALFTQFPVRGSLGHSFIKEDSHEDGTLLAYDFSEQRCGSLANQIGEIRLAADGRTLVYRSGCRLRAINALEPLGDGDPRPPIPDDASRRSGWIDLSRISVLVEPRDEWAQMYYEAWRLQREQFWDEAMSQVDWNVVRDRYAKLLPRVRTRGELSDLFWEMQGELGTSHAYEYFGDYRRPPSYRVGLLGADLAFDEASGGYKIKRILRGDSWNRDTDSPLAEPGLRVREGEIIVNVGGHPVNRQTSVEALLVNLAGREVALTLLDLEGVRRRVIVKTLRDERALRYREWVEANRRLVHERSNGRVGYVHIPDMGPAGFAEFHRGFLAEFNRGALVVDARYNRGGHVSALLLEKLSRSRVGYDIPRHGVPRPYPDESVAGPMVGLTNQFAGSDGDIFSHCFKLYKLGPLVGKRTWGGVIGIWPQHPLVDGTVTTQPEFSFWFVDVGWKVENYGTDPDYEVDVAPQDYRDGKDPQMDKALGLILDELQRKPVKLPSFDGRPNLAPPKLPPRT